MLRWKSLLVNSPANSLANTLVNCCLPKGIRRKQRPHFALARRLAVESLEDRRLLAVITVDSAADNTNDDGMITLREAIVAANTNAVADPTEAAQAGSAGADTINFAAGLNGQTILLGGTEIEITEVLTIDATALAAGVTVDAQLGSRIFNITAVTGDFALSGLRLTNGRTVGINDDGGAVRSMTTGTVTLDQTTVSGSVTRGQFAEGGGVFVSGNLTLTHATLSGNSTTGGSAEGGGAYVYDDLTLTHSTLSGNRTTGDSAAGGGAFVDGNFMLTNSTVSGNSTAGDNAAGGGAYVYGNFTLASATLSGNSTTGSSVAGGALVNNDLSLANSIIGDNSAGIGAADFATGINSGTLTASFSLLEDLTGLSATQSAAFLAGMGNLTAVDPLLGPLANNGGPTETHALLPGSPAIDAGDPAVAMPPTNDQRGAGFARIIDGDNDGTAVIDMGATESEPPPEVTLVGGVLAFNDVSAPDVDDLITIQLAGANLLITSNQPIRSTAAGSTGSGTDQVRVPVAGITRIDVNTMAGNDRLTIDYAGGFITQDIVFDGGDPTSGIGAGIGDSLVVTGGAAVAATHYAFSSASSGSIAIDFAGGGTDATITYTGLEPITDNLNVANRVFTFDGGTETISLSDDGTASDNRSMINSTLGESVTFVNPTSALTIDAGSGDDAVHVTGTDTMTVIPSLVINGGDGNDTLTVVPSLTAITVSGGAPAAGDAGIPPGDRLILALPSGVTLDNNPATPADTAMLTGAADVIFSSIEQLIIVAADLLENNNTLATASVLGSPTQVTINDLSIHEPGNVDFFKFIAPESGKLMVNLFFDHTIGDLDLEVQDMFGNVIETSSRSTDELFSEQLVIPVVDQEMFFVRVFGVGGAVNNYDLTLQNRIAPTPTMPTLHPDDHDGSNRSNPATEVTDPRVLVQADLADFAAMGIPILAAVDAANGMMTGAAVEVFLNGASQGFAERVGTSTTLFLFTLDPAGLAGGLPVSDGVLNYVTAAVRIFDGQLDAAGGNPARISGRTALSEQLALRSVDTTGPQISNVSIPGFAGFDLFAPKPSAAGPTPAIHQLAIDFTDLPVRGGIFAGDALAAALAENPAFYALIGDATGPVAVQRAEMTATSALAGNRATATVTLTFAQPLPDDRFTFTVHDNLTDLAGNALDGESAGTQPAGGLASPSGDGMPGGDFVARFTVDSRPEIGVWAAGMAGIDSNGNFLFDPENLDMVNRDITYHLGFSSDNIFAGNFSGPGPDLLFGTADDGGAAAGDAVADRFDKLAAYGRVGNQWRWMIDRTNDGVPDLFINEPMNINGFPVAGNFDGNVANGDEVGVFDGTQWFFDTDHDFQLDAGSVVPSFGMGFPIVGDFDGNGTDDLGNYTAVSNAFGGNRFSINLRNAMPIVTFQVGMAGDLVAGGFNGFAGVRERPVAADMNADGIDDIGLWVPDGSALVPGNQGEWYFLVSGDIVTTPGVVEVSVLSRIDNGLVAYTATPFGNDTFARFGNSYAVPLVGNFDPPLAADAALTASASLTPPINRSSSTTAKEVILSTTPSLPGTTPIVIEEDSGSASTADSQPLPLAESPEPVVTHDREQDQGEVERPLVREPSHTETPEQDPAEVASDERAAADWLEESMVPVVDPIVASVAEEAMKDIADPVGETVSLEAGSLQELPVKPEDVEPAADTARLRLLGAKEGLLGAKEDLLGAKEALLGAKEGPLGAKEGPLDAKEHSLGEKKGLLDEKVAALDEDKLTRDRKQADEDAPTSSTVAATINTPPPQRVSKVFSRISWRPSMASSAAYVVSTTTKTPIVRESSTETAQTPTPTLVDQKQVANPDLSKGLVQAPIGRAVAVSSAEIQLVAEVASAKDANANFANAPLATAPLTTSAQKRSQQVFSRANWGYGTALEHAITATPADKESVVVATPQETVDRVAVSVETTAARSTAAISSTPAATTASAPTASIRRQTIALELPSPPQSRSSEPEPNAAEAVRAALVHPLQSHDLQAHPLQTPALQTVSRYAFSIADDRAAQHANDFSTTDTAFHEEAIIAADSTGFEPPIGQSHPVASGDYRAEIDAQVLFDLAEALALVWSR